jgi:hypothetical protein
MRTDLPICRTCGVQYGAPREDCPVCLDERQYVGWDGQQWVTMAELAAAGHRSRVAEEGPGVLGVGTEPAVAIGQRALLVLSPAGNVMFDMISYLDDELLATLAGLGGVSAIAISHPHFYGAIVKRVEFPAEDHSRELAEVTETLESLDAERRAGRLSAAAYARLAATWEAERERLAELPQRPARVEAVPTGETFGSKWQGLRTTAGRRMLMQTAGFRVLAWRDRDDSITVMALAGKDLAERTAKAAGGWPQDPRRCPRRWPSWACRCAWCTSPRASAAAPGW